MSKLYIAAFAMAALAANAQNITSLDQLNSRTVVTIQRLPAEADTCGYLSYVEPLEDGTINKIVVDNAVEEISDNQLWVLCCNDVDKQYQLYNLAAKACVNVANGYCTFNSPATIIEPKYISEVGGWALTGNDYMLGLNSSCKNAVYFLKESATANLGTFFSITPTDRQLTDDEIQTIDSAVNTSRLQQIEAYRQFVAAAKSFNSTAKANYCGVYDIDALDEALSSDNVDSMPLATLEALKLQALEATMPVADGYYRIKNVERPTNRGLNNYMTLALSGESLFAQTSTDLGLSNLSNTAENLRLFRFIPVSGLGYDRFRVSVAALDKSMTNVALHNAVGFTSNENGAVFQLVRVSDTSDLFKLQYNAENKRLTTNGAAAGQVIVPNSVTETSMQWYIERIYEFAGPQLDEYGYASVELPCPVEVPDGVKAYYADNIIGDCVSISNIDIQSNGIIPAYQPVIVQGTPGASLTFTIAKADAATADFTNYLAGTTRYLEVGGDVFLPSVDSNGEISFVRTTVESLAANSVYIDASSINADELSVKLSTDLSSITDIDVDANVDVRHYNLQGIQVDKPDHGVYIRVQGNKATKVAK